MDIQEQSAIDDARFMFEEVYLGNSKQAATKNTTTGDYVHPSVEDAWSGWKALWLLKFKYMYSGTAKD